jgi:5'-3' exonuclease
MRQTKCNTIFFAGESYTTLNRTKMDNTYKSGRKSPPDKDFKVYTGCLKAMMKALNLNIIHYPGSEGDDIIASLCSLSRNNKIYILSIDKDLRQLLDKEKVVIVLPDTYRTIYTEEQFYKEHRFEPRRYVYYKALVGDKSDSISGVDGIGDVKAREIMNTSKLEDIFARLSHDEYMQFMHALKLITLNTKIPLKTFEKFLAGKSCTQRQLRMAKRIYVEYYGNQLVEGVMNEFKKIFGVDTMRSKIIAVDFDGTLVENKWPEIGPMREAIFESILKEKQSGANIILWTCRRDKELNDAITFCNSHGLTFDKVNDNLEYVKEFMGGDTRKIFADEYWDDRAYRV